VKTGGEFCDYAGEQGVLGGMDFVGKCFEGIVGGARDLGLAEVGAAIDFRRYPMDRAPACRDASTPGLADAIQPREGRQEGGV
jgi:hypothetical protein